MMAVPAFAGQTGLRLSGYVEASTYNINSDNGGGYYVVSKNPAYRVYVARMQAARMPASQVWSEAQVLPLKDWKQLKIEVTRHLTTSSYIRVVAP